MKGLKELKQTSITVTVKVKVSKTDRDTSYYRHEDTTLTQPSSSITRRTARCLQ